MSAEHKGISVRLEGNADATVWAHEFAKVVTLGEDQKWDLDFLVGWFANAIETGRDAGARQDADKLRQAVKDEHERGILALGYVSAELASRSGAWDGNAPEWFPQPPDWLELWEEGYLHGVIEDDDDE
jgi:hypothetical protein